MTRVNERVYLKIGIFGDHGVGRTSFQQRYIKRKFPESFEERIDYPPYNKTVTHIDTGNEVKIQIYDFAPEIMMHLNLRSFHTAMVLYDVGDQSSFKNAQGIINSAQSYFDTDCQVILVGTKNDILPVDKVIEYETAEAYADNKNIPFFEVSAKTGKNINAVFSCAIDLKMVALNRMLGNNLYKQYTADIDEMLRVYNRCCHKKSLTRKLSRARIEHANDVLKSACLDGSPYKIKQAYDGLIQCLAKEQQITKQSHNNRNGCLKVFGRPSRLLQGIDNFLDKHSLKHAADRINVEGKIESVVLTSEDDSLLAGREYKAYG
ncbi:MAG: GTP-binding protein [Coxiellaceae bacterium]|nr:GTP-binding protein [Coxiellaceae bacterium]